MNVHPNTDPQLNMSSVTAQTVEESMTRSTCAEYDAKQEHASSTKQDVCCFVEPEVFLKLQINIVSVPVKLLTQFTIHPEHMS